MKRSFTPWLLAFWLLGVSCTSKELSVKEVVKIQDIENMKTARFRGIAGSSKLGAFVRGKQFVCYVDNQREWPKGLDGQEVEIEGEMRTVVVRGAQDGDAGATAEPGSEIVYVKLRKVAHVRKPGQT